MSVGSGGDCDFNLGVLFCEERECVGYEFCHAAVELLDIGREEGRKGQEYRDDPPQSQ